jgi:hypothetical protein
MTQQASKEGNVRYTKTTPSKGRDLRALKRLGERGGPRGRDRVYIYIYMILF